MGNRIYADFLGQFVAEDDEHLLEQLGVSIREWKGFPYLDELRTAYKHLNNKRSRYARHIIFGVIGEILANEKTVWTAEEILRREG